MYKTRKEMIKEFVDYRKASEKWNDTYDYHLLAFDKYCDLNSDDPGLLQEMVDQWSEKHDSELNQSRNRRILAIRDFILYLQERGMTSIIEPELFRDEVSNYVPHAFSAQELHDFFDEADRQVIDSRNDYSAFRALTATVIFRLLYSSGMRTTEVRLLKVEDADLEHGILSINSTKANLRHFVVLHDDVKSMLERYNATASRRMPDRDYFFVSINGNVISHGTLTLWFQQIWKKISHDRAVPYDLRHHYAITNINSWTDAGFDFHDKFLYLSKSMGHTSLESTRYYYTLVPALADTICAQSGKSFDEIVPEVTMQ